MFHPRCSTLIKFRWSGGNCAVYYGGGGWWHNYDTYAHLNSRWGEGLGEQGIVWYTWKQLTSLKSSMMMVQCTV